MKVIRRLALLFALVLALSACDLYEGQQFTVKWPLRGDIEQAGAVINSNTTTLLMEGAWGYYCHRDDSYAGSLCVASFLHNNYHLHGWGAAEFNEATTAPYANAIMQNALRPTYATARVCISWQCEASGGTSHWVYNTCILLSKSLIFGGLSWDTYGSAPC